MALCGSVALMVASDPQYLGYLFPTFSKILKSRQVDYSNAFVQAELDTEVYVELPKLFEAKQGGEPMVLKLQKNLYGLNQALLL